MLVTYEMQWTVCYFLDKSTKWQQGAQSLNVSSGAMAYAHQHSTMWQKLADIADTVFTNMTTHYVSPL